MQSATLDGQTFKKLLSGGAANLQQNSKTVDDLNVFPIPDGDTGENMSRTIRGGLSDLEGYGGNSIYEAASILADGMLLSARGNSGVILSRLFYGVAKGLEDKKEATVGDMAAALKSGVDSAYSAVANPTEGTILTVAREAADYAASRINENSTLESFGNDYYNELCASLKRTPELLSVLKEAGVIDSGGAGLYYIMDGIMKTVRGEQPEATEISVEQKDGLDLSLFDENSVMTYGYCTEFLLRLQNFKVNIDGLSVEDMIKWLNTVGDSVVAFKNGTAVKVHVHTLTPGKVLEHFQQYGEFLTVKIENMTLQHSEVTIENRFEVPKPKKKKKFALVCVAAGEGMKNTLFSMGVDQIVDGGQSMNPSTGDFLDAFGKIDAETIFVFPNNGNVILTAHQAAELYKKADVRVVQSKNIGQGYAGVSMFDTSSDNADEIEKELADALENVVTGSVSRSIRDTEKDGIRIQTGDYIGFVDDRIYVAAPDALTAAKELARKLDASSKDILLLLCGAEAKEEEARKLYEELKAECRRAEVIFIDGGQPVFDYVLVLE